jgi:hypothetical protein
MSVVWMDEFTTLQLVFSVLCVVSTTITTKAEFVCTPIRSGHIVAYRRYFVYMHSIDSMNSLQLNVEGQRILRDSA